jgi:hypothetical protein
MLQLKELNAIRQLTQIAPHKLSAVKFGYETLFEDADIELLLAQVFVPQNEVLLVSRTQSYMVNALNSASDYNFYRATPSGIAVWALGASDGTFAFTTASLTDDNSPAHLLLDSDEHLLFPGGYFARLIFTPDAAAPATGTWNIRTLCYGWFIPIEVSDQLDATQVGINLR